MSCGDPRNGEDQRSGRAAARHRAARSALSLLGGLLALLLPARAELGRIHYQAIALDRVVQLSSHIVVAQAIERSRRTQKVELGPRIRPYAYVLERYRVLEHLWPKKEARAGEELTVTSFDGDELRRHAEYYARGLRRSPIVTSYQPSAPLDPKAPMILFLKRQAYLRYSRARRSLTGRSDTFKQVVAGAIEHPAKKAAVSAIARDGDHRALEIVVGVCKSSDALQERIGGLLRRRLPQEAALDWTAVEICPSGQGPPRRR